MNSEVPTIRGSGWNRFATYGIRGGREDQAYIVSLSQGQLFLGGRMTVSRIVSRDAAPRVLGTDRLYPAVEWLIDDTDEGGTRLQLNRRLAHAGRHT